MNVWSAVRRFDIEQLWRLSILMLQYPLHIFPTWQATRYTLKICNKLYGETHHAIGKANAFRHALWTFLICRNIFVASKNEEKSVFWAKKITDFHEKLSPNQRLDTQMDLHNNNIGLSYFRLFKDSSKEEIITFIKENAQKAIKVTSIEAINKNKKELVYISEI